MAKNSSIALPILVLVVVGLLNGCAGTANRGNAGASNASPAQPASATGVAPGMNANGEVIDSKQVTAGSGTRVKGINGYEGEITGKPAKNSKFTTLQIGMPMKQVTDLIGQPTDQGAYITGKAFIPFYFGGDTYRYEMAYKGLGRLVFAGGSMMGNMGGGNLIWIIHNSNDSGYR
jgi:hypothetical protein